MSFLRHSCYATAILAAAAACAGCANPASPVPSVGSAIRNAGKSGGALLYISDMVSGSVSFYSYPGLAFKGEISGFKNPGPLCTDPRTGDVWVVSGLNPYKLSEFKHGGMAPVRTVKFAPFDVLLAGCAVNPTNGDLAVTEVSEYDDPGSLVVFRNGAGKPNSYQSGNIFYYDFVAYDSTGNAFVDGGGSSRGMSLDELRSGSKKLVNVTPHHWRLRPLFAGGVQYDGADVAVGGLKHGRIFRISDREVVGTTKIIGTCQVRQFAIDGETLIAPSACHSHGEVLFYDYPGGGNPTTKLTGFQLPYAVTISQ